MQLQSFFDEVPRLRVQDPLARLQGCARDGVLEYGFGDAVRLTGQACPAVASAYWLTYLALEYLYPDRLPERGNIKVEFRDDTRSGTTGVVATVIQMLTGAAGRSGYKGLRGRHGRAGLIRHRPDLLLSLRFTRQDTRLAIDADVDLSLVPTPPGLEDLLARSSTGRATPQEELLLGQLWQERVHHLLIGCAREPSVFVLRPVERCEVLPLMDRAAA